MTILFVNHTQKQCGVYQFGKRVYELSSTSKITDYYYLETETESEFMSKLEEVKPNVVIYNWYPVTMSWLSESFIEKRKDIKHLFIFHDGHMRLSFDKYIFSGSIGKNITLPDEKIFVLPRPLFVYEGEYATNNIVTIGSFGFGGWQKGFPELVKKVNDEFERAIININMSFAYFGDQFGVETRKIADACRKFNTNPGIELNIDHSFLSNDDILKFLASNDLNVFLYYSTNQGLSSVVDYALSVKRPIAISNDSMFKHLFKEEICSDYHSLKSILDAGIKPLQEFYDRWNPEDFSTRMDELLHEYK
jgi:hypothetical protein